MSSSRDFFLSRSSQARSVQDDSEKLSAYLHTVLAGNGDDRWVDKSFNYVIGVNGRVRVIEWHRVAEK